jgi:hypothetical protein
LDPPTNAMTPVTIVTAKTKNHAAG